jgi:phosphatidylinositol alpha-1,6-mannosyltransferase
MLHAVVKSWRPHVIIASGEQAVWLSSIVLGDRGIPWVAIWHGVSPKEGWKRALTRWSYSRARAVIAVSEYSHQRLLQLGVHPRCHYVIPNGADSDYFHPLDPQAINPLRESYLPDGGVILLSVGHVTERKGHDVVIRALPQVLSEFPDVQYLVVGLPTLRNSLEDLAENLGVKDHVQFLGRVDMGTLLAAYNACDLFLMTSRKGRDGSFEGYGIAAVEAALCGKPSIVSANSGLAEAVLDGKTGIVVDQGDSQVTAHAILQLLHDTSLRIHLGQAARRRAIEEQTWRSRAAQYEAVLCALCPG